ncbi:Molybdenum cofactor biosynthesis protein 1 like [Verticillium longisporum]|uniref:Molybdenum cofactor biosynthesis protein 1 like n=1 Tax=Verticillium longisporum TaxID=100787 RepID=A0A8I3ARX4_VERLO|nr:Molybdenum cofactor biosynthesis protein 1 like [Verticillium longisporum]
MRHAIWRRASLVGCRASRRQPTPRCLTTAAAVTPSVTPDPAPHPALPANSTSNRRDALRDAKPFSDFLTDNFSRQHDYLRISVTERCNLRCVYCMPEEGVPLSPSRDILTTPEIVMLSSVFVNQGVTKIRLTGGEPTVRRDIVPLMRQLGALRPHGLQELCLTTNGLSRS